MLGIWFIAISIVMGILIYQVWLDDTNDTGDSFLCSFVLIVIWAGLNIPVWINIHTIADNYAINQQILILQEENADIEDSLSNVIENFLDHEKEVFIETTTESSITLIALYPELKSDELVNKQMDVYVENNERIRELRIKETKVSTARWWLWFGR